MPNPPTDNTLGFEQINYALVEKDFESLGFKRILRERKDCVTIIFSERNGISKFYFKEKI